MRSAPKARAISALVMSVTCGISTVMFSESTTRPSLARIDCLSSAGVKPRISEVSALMRRFTGYSRGVS